MSRENRHRSLTSSPSGQPRSWLRRHAFWLSLGLVMVASVAGAYCFTQRPDPSVAATPQPIAATVQKAFTLDKLLAMPSEELKDVDIAEMNLLCATGLPGAEKLDVAKCLARLDEWAARVKAETERHLYRLTDPRYADHAAHYKHSEARFRAEWLVNILQQDIGVHYFPGFTPPDKPVVMPKTSKECFLHGFMDNDDPHKAFGGNCLSLPVVYAAVGRRLGYPIKLVSALEHAFCRWEGTDHPNPAWRDRFNFDGAGEGFSIDPDEFYLSWPRKCNPDNVVLCEWLKSLTPQQELSLFMGHRGLILRVVAKDYAAALVAYSHCLRLWPTSRAPLQEVQETAGLLWAREVAAHPEIYRRKYGVEVAGDQVVPIRQAARQQDPYGNVEMVNEINRRNMERMTRSATPPQPYQPAMPGVPQAPSPYEPYGPQQGVPQPYQPPGPGQPPR